MLRTLAKTFVTKFRLETFRFAQRAREEKLQKRRVYFVLMQEGAHHGKVRSDSVRDPFGVHSGSIQSNFGPKVSEQKSWKLSNCAIRKIRKLENFQIAHFEKFEKFEKKRGLRLAPPLFRVCLGFVLFRGLFRLSRVFLGLFRVRLGFVLFV